jgi:hypothetical protein
LNAACEFRQLRIPEDSRPNRLDLDKFISNEIINLFAKEGIRSFRILTSDPRISLRAVRASLRPLDFDIIVGPITPFALIDLLASRRDPTGVLAIGSYKHRLAPPIQALIQSVQHFSHYNHNHHSWSLPRQEQIRASLEMFPERPGNFAKIVNDISNAPSPESSERAIWGAAVTIFSQNSLRETAILPTIISQTSELNGPADLFSVAEKTLTLTRNNFPQNLPSTVVIGSSNRDVAAMMRHLMEDLDHDWRAAAWEHSEARGGRHPTLSMLEFATLPDRLGVFIELDYYPFVPVIVKWQRPPS